MPDKRRAEDQYAAVYARVCETVARITGQPSSSLTGQTALLADLAMDSLAVFEVVIELEEAFCIQISDEEIDRIRTLDEIVAYVIRHKPAASGNQA